MLDDAYNYLRLRNLSGNHCTTRELPANELRGQSLGTLGPLTLTHCVSADRDCLELAPKLLVWSAADEGGIPRLAKTYSILMAQLASSLSTPEASTYVENLAYTLAARRTSLSWKSFAVASSVQDLQGLASKLSKPVRSKSSPKLGYVFTGQGAQFAGMSKELLAFPIFLDSLRRSDMYLNQLGCQWSLLGMLSNCLLQIAANTLPHLAIRSEAHVKSFVVYSMKQLFNFHTTILLFLRTLTSRENRN